MRIYSFLFFSFMETFYSDFRWTGVDSIALIITDIFDSFILIRLGQRKSWVKKNVFFSLKYDEYCSKTFGRVRSFRCCCLWTWNDILNGKSLVWALKENCTTRNAQLSKNICHSRTNDKKWKNKESFYIASLWLITILGLIVFVTLFLPRTVAGGSFLTRFIY